MLERGLAQRARGEHDDAGIGGVGGSRVLQAAAEDAEERRQPLHLGVAVEAREHPGGHHPVLEGVARSRGCLRAVGEHHDGAVRRPGQVDGGHEELPRTGHAHLVARSQERRVTEHEGRRDQAALEQLAGAVEVGEDEIEELGPLVDPPLDGGPLLGRDDHRDGVDLPPAAAPLGVAVHVVGDAVVVEEPLGLLAAPDQLVDTELGNERGDRVDAAVGGGGHPGDSVAAGATRRGRGRRRWPAWRR